MNFRGRVKDIRIEKYGLRCRKRWMKDQKREGSEMFKTSPKFISQFEVSQCVVRVIYEISEIFIYGVNFFFLSFGAFFMLSIFTRLSSGKILRGRRTCIRRAFSRRRCSIREKWRSPVCRYTFRAGRKVSSYKLYIYSTRRFPSPLPPVRVLLSFRHRRYQKATDRQGGLLVVVVDKTENFILCLTNKVLPPRQTASRLIYE